MKGLAISTEFPRSIFQGRFPKPAPLLIATMFALGICSATEAQEADSADVVDVDVAVAAVADGEQVSVAVELPEAAPPRRRLRIFPWRQKTKPATEPAPVPGPFSTAADNPSSEEDVAAVPPVIEIPELSESIQEDGEESAAKRRLFGRWPFGGAREKTEADSLDDISAGEEEHAGEGGSIDSVGDESVSDETVSEVALQDEGEKIERFSLFRSPFGRKRDGEVESEIELASGDELLVSKVERKEFGEQLAETADEDVEIEEGDKRRWFAWLGGKKRRDGENLEPGHEPDLGIGEKYVITLADTSFFVIGPNQPLPPDEILGEGMLVTMRKRGWGWSDIELADGKMGVVTSKALRKATAKEQGLHYASSGRGGDTPGLWKVFGYNKAPEPELPSDSGGIPLGLSLLPALDSDE